MRLLRKEIQQFLKKTEKQSLQYIQTFAKIRFPLLQNFTLLKIVETDAGPAGATFLNVGRSPTTNTKREASPAGAEQEFVLKPFVQLRVLVALWRLPLPKGNRHSFKGSPIAAYALSAIKFAFHYQVAVALFMLRILHRAVALC